MKMRKSPILNPGYIYVLNLGKNRVYVGETGDLKRRLREHLTGLYYDTKKRKWTRGGAVMTRNFKPQRLVGLYRPELTFPQFRELVTHSADLLDVEKELRVCRRETETNLTLQYMKTYGRECVRGAKWCTLNKVPEEKVLETLESPRPSCKCDRPAEKTVEYTGNSVWVCGAHLIHDMFGTELIPSTEGLLLPLSKKIHLPVLLSCDWSSPVERQRFLPENKAESQT